MAIYRRKASPIKIDASIDYKDVELLSNFLTEQGKILPKRLTGLTNKQQNRITKAIKRARILSLLPFVNREGAL
jgi:small subunit ribosomal protein S18